MTTSSTRAKRRAHERQKRAWLAALARQPYATPELLAVARMIADRTDENGTITDPFVNALLSELDREAGRA